MVNTITLEKPFLDFNGTLTEGITYNPSNNTLLWVDIVKGEVHRVKLLKESKAEYSEEEVSQIVSTHEVFHTPGKVGVIGLTKDNDKVVCGCEKGLGLLEFSSDKFKYLSEFEESLHEEKTQSNDGQIDNEGNFWFGTMATFESGHPGPVGKLFRFNKDLTKDVITTGAMCPNGLAFANDSKSFFWADSYTFIIWKFDYDAATGEVSNRRPFIEVNKYLEEGQLAGPDGFTMTADGEIYVAVWGSSCVFHFDVQGELVEKIQVPAICVACATFGGVDGDELFITTAHSRLLQTWDQNDGIENDKGGAIFRMKIAGVVPQVKKVWGGEI